MKNNEPSDRSVVMVSLISGVAGFINGVLVILAGTSYFYPLSPYSWMLGALFLVAPGQFVDQMEEFLYRSGVQLLLAPLLGAFWGAVIGRVASRSNKTPTTLSLVKTAALTGGLGGLVSLGIIFLNVYAS